MLYKIILKNSWFGVSDRSGDQPVVAMLLALLALSNQSDKFARNGDQTIQKF